MPGMLRRALTSEERFFESLLRRTLGNEQRRLNGPTVREVATRNPELFVVAAISLLEATKSPPMRSRLYLKLSECPEFLLQLIHPERFNPAQFLEICRALKRIDDRLDIKLARLLPGRHADEYELPGDVLLRLLNVLHAISRGPRLVQVLCHLTGHTDQRIASKATILMGHRLRSDHWLRAQLQSTNGRLRASAVEALWGVDGSYSRKHLIACLKDENNRVVGNALFGLHFLGEPTVERSLELMRSDARASFRQTAAWLMGRIGKPEFAEALQAAAEHDDDEAVRTTATRALEGIELAIAEAEAAETPAGPAAEPAPPEYREQVAEAVRPRQEAEAAPEPSPPPKEEFVFTPRLDGRYHRL